MQSASIQGTNHSARFMTYSRLVMKVYRGHEWRVLLPGYTTLHRTISSWFPGWEEIKRTETIKTCDKLRYIFPASVSPCTVTLLAGKSKTLFLFFFNKRLVVHGKCGDKSGRLMILHWRTHGRVAKWDVLIIHRHVPAMSSCPGSFTAKKNLQI